MYVSLSLSSAVNVPVVFAEPLQMGVAPCSARSYWMRRGWACTSASCATWPMRFCHARRTADGTSIRADSVLLLCSWPSLPLYRYTSPSSVWLFLLYVALWVLQISTFDQHFIHQYTCDQSETFFQKFLFMVRRTFIFNSIKYNILDTYFLLMLLNDHYNQNFAKKPVAHKLLHAFWHQINNLYFFSQ